MDKNRYTLLISNTVIFAIGNILVKLISFFLMPLYTSVMTTEQYGVSELLNSAVEIIFPLVTLCIVEALYRFSIDDDQDYGTLFTNSFSIVILGDLLVIIFSIILHYVFLYKYAFEFGLLFCTTSFYRLTIQFARGMGHTKRYALYGVINSLILVTANYILLVINGGGVKAYLISFSLGYGISGIGSFIFSGEYRYLQPKKYSKNTMKQMLKYSMPCIPNMLSWWINSISDRYIILFFWGSGIAGLYTAASKLPAMMNLITSIFQQAWQYSTSKEIDTEDNKEFFLNVFKAYSFICMFICAVLISLNKIVCMVLLKKDFYIAWKFVPILLLAAMFGGLSYYFAAFYNAKKENKMLMLSTVTGAVLNVILNFTLIPKIGGMGAAVATAISYVLVLVIRMIDISKKISLDINYGKLIFQFIFLTIYAFFASFFDTNLIFVAGVLVMVGLMALNIDLMKDMFIFLKKK